MEDKPQATDFISVARISRIIASAVFDVLRRANVLLIDQPGQSNPEIA
jgi:hypothetical protein